ncbi:MAG: rod shape-determining protein MreC [Chloroflexota bacterium]|nr:rod shape-determining protein MreC [Chloroflexota bacterium]
MTDTRRGLTAFLIVGLMALALLVLSGQRWFDPVENALGAVAEPVQRTLAPVASGMRSVFSGLGSGTRLQSENRALQSEVDRLTAENVRLRLLQSENDELRQQLGFTTSNPELSVVQASVIGRDPASVRQYLVIDRGTADGIARNMAVVQSGGALIGKVLRVESRRAEVLLLTDIESAVNAKVERTGADGIVEGQWQKGSLLEMRYIEQGPTADGAPRIQKNDWVVTSGLGGNVPDGLLIGRVASVTQSDSGLEQRAQVLPAVDVRAVGTVLVVRAAQP